MYNRWINRQALKNIDWELIKKHWNDQPDHGKGALPRTIFDFIQKEITKQLQK